MDAEAVPSGPMVDGATEGVVATFDEPGGYGTVTDADGQATWFFHCTAIADGTRKIATGTSVRFEVVPGHLGRYEAVNLRPA